MYDGIVLGLPNNESANGMIVYPNPAQDQLVIDFGTNLSDATIGIFNSLGQEVKQVSVNGNSGTISTVELTNGTYFCRLVSGSKVAVRKFVVQH